MSCKLLRPARFPTSNPKQNANMKVNHADTLKSDMKNSGASSPTLTSRGKSLVWCIRYGRDRDRSRRCGPQREEPLRLHSPRHCPSKSCQHWQHQRKAGMLFMRTLKPFPQAQSQENLWRDHGGAGQEARQELGSLHSRSPWGSSVGAVQAGWLWSWGKPGAPLHQQH